MIDLALATSEQKVPVVMRNASDAVVTGLTSPTITASKGGGSFASLSDGTWAEVGNGLYTIRLNDTDTDTLGWMMIHVAHGSAESAFVEVNVSISSSEERSNYIRVRRANLSYV
jgi:Ca2+-binding RTX toxin-like protein